MALSDGAGEAFDADAGELAEGGEFQEDPMVEATQKYEAAQSAVAQAKADVEGAQRALAEAEAEYNTVKGA